MKRNKATATGGCRSYGGLSAAPRGGILLFVCSAIALVLVAVGSSARSAACSICGKNLVQNPGAESGKGQNAVNGS